MPSSTARPARPARHARHVRQARPLRRALATVLVLALAACSSSTEPGIGGDDALVFANSSDIEVTVALTHPSGTETEHTLPRSNMAGETRIDVSFIAGEQYTFVLSNPNPGVEPSLVTTCTVSEVAERDGVASILVVLDIIGGRFQGLCLTNWVESAV